jgi:hypothetical protein
MRVDDVASSIYQAHGIGLACIQKLIANDAIAPHHLPAVVATLVQQAEVLDESVQLKCLQGVLTILQSKVGPCKFTHMLRSVLGMY